VSPILVRPVREQLEHDRIIRLLQTKWKRKYEAGMNPGSEQNAAVGTGPSATYPDLVLLSQERGRRLQGVIEVETGESVNHLEALSQWAYFARLRAAFHLYVPAGMVDVARRLCEENQIHVTEIWSYHLVGDQFRFTLVHRSRETPAARARATAQPAATARPAAAAAVRPAVAARPVVAARKPPARAAKTKSAARPRKPAKKPAKKPTKKPARSPNRK
jgi:hypothetical protein